MNRTQWEILQRARGRLAEPQRWARGAAARNAAGEESLTLEEQGAVAWDIVGAVAEEAGEVITDAFCWILEDSDCETVLLEIAKRLPSHYRIEPRTGLARLWAGWVGARTTYTGNEACTDIMCWQDLEGRQHAEVLELLDRTLNETTPEP